MVAIDPASIRAYYDEFAEAYERCRRPAEPTGYHALVDDLEMEWTERYGAGRSVLECGCGTGLLLERIAQFASSAEGIDLSPRMLDQARARGLVVTEGSLTELPFPDASFEVTCAFKVLAHIPEIHQALSEMVRVTKPGGVILAEFYNPMSLRGLVKRFGPAGRISSTTRENAVYTRYDAPRDIPSLLPPGVTVEAACGIRIVTPFAGAMRIPVLGRWLQTLERKLSGGMLRTLGGFYLAVLRKESHQAFVS